MDFSGIWYEVVRDDKGKAVELDLHEAGVITDGSRTAFVLKYELGKALACIKLPLDLTDGSARKMLDTVRASKSIKISGTECELASGWPFIKITSILESKES